MSVLSIFVNRSYSKIYRMRVFCNC